MELGLSLGETPKAFTFLEKSSSAHEKNKKMVVSNINNNNNNKDLGFCMALQVKGCDNEEGENNNNNNNNNKKTRYDIINERRDSSDPPVQLDLLPFSPVNISRTSSSNHLMTFSWLTENLGVESSSGLSKRQTEVNRRSIGVEKVGTGGEEGTTGSFLSSSPNSTTSSFQMEFSMYRSSSAGGGGGGGVRSSNNYKRDFEGNEIEENDRDRNGACSRASDEEENENGMARKKLRLSKEQSAFLEESFKEHNTLNPKQKQALAKQLNLRPRQVEVWFQNRRARTKLKQTEVDCEYLKKCCETLTEENRRLQKELQELRALKSSQPFYMQLPATTLTMCPSCERVATTATAATTTPAATNGSTTTTAVAGTGTTTANTTLSLAKPRAVHHHHQHQHHHQHVTS